MLRKLLCKLGKHQWHTSDVVQVEEGYTRQDQWCPHCGERRELKYYHK